VSCRTASSWQSDKGRFCIQFKGSALQEEQQGEVEVILGAIPELRKATFGFVVSVCPSVRSHRTTLLPLECGEAVELFENVPKIRRKKFKFR